MVMATSCEHSQELIVDRQFPTPQDVARAGTERLHEALNAWLRRGVVDQPFVLRQRFEYDGGRRGPMLFIGNINRSWRDYINGNARATDLVTGTCTSGREAGRAVVMMHIDAGRGATAGNQLEVNRALRAVNLEVRFGSADNAGTAAPVIRPDAATAPTPAGVVGEMPEAAPAEHGDATPVSTASAVDEPVAVGSEAPPVTVQSLAEMAREMKTRFDAFRTAPSREALDELNTLIQVWRDGATGAQGAEASKAGEFVTKLEALLAAKGEAFVSQNNG